MYGEDIDLSYKVLKVGYKNYYYGKTTIIHFKGESTLKDKIMRNDFIMQCRYFIKSILKKIYS